VVGEARRIADRTGARIAQTDLGPHDECCLGGSR
jgi:hypothetical protein